MAYGASKPPGPKLDVLTDDLLPYYASLKDGTPVVVQRILKPEQLAAHLAARRRRGSENPSETAADATSSSGNNSGAGGSKALSPPSARRGWNRYVSHYCTEPNTLASVRLLLNYEIEHAHNSYPFEHALSEEQFSDYFLGNDAFVVRALTLTPKVRSRIRESRALLARAGPPNKPSSSSSSSSASASAAPFSHALPPQPVLPDPYLVAAFYIKPNYPGRSAHLCNGGFLVNFTYRGCGAGFLCGTQFLRLAHRLGYRGSVFNLVFSDNPGSARLWDRLGFTRAGALPGAGRRQRRRADGSLVSAAPPITGTAAEEEEEEERKKKSGGGGGAAEEKEGEGEDPHHTYADATMYYYDLRRPPAVTRMPWEAAHTAQTEALTAARPHPPPAVMPSSL